MGAKSNIPGLIKKYENEIFVAWMKEQLAALTLRPELISEVELERQSKKFLKAFQEACHGGEITDITGPIWEKVREILGNISASRAKQGFTPSETATFIFFLKQPLFTLIQREFEKDQKILTNELWSITVILDKLGLYTTEVFIKSKEEIIKRQQFEMLELSTPVVKIWDKILALPLIGTLDSARTQVVMENLLQQIVETSSNVAIIDITGVPMVDTLVAQHLLKTVSAARLMGAECIISGIRPQIAQAMVHLGVVFSEIPTKATLADAIQYAFKLTGINVIQANIQG